MANKNGDKTRSDDEKNVTTLETFLVACQKSLARSVKSAQQAGKSDSEFAQGERPVYVIDEVGFDLSAGVHIEAGNGKLTGERVLLDFDAPSERRSTLQFTVAMKPVEILIGAKLELANLDPLGEQLPDARLRAWLVDDQGRPVPDHTVTLHFCRGGYKTVRQVETKTSPVGRIDFLVRSQENEVKVVGVRKPFETYLRGAVDEYYVWATTERKKEWKNIVEPSAPHPPRHIARDKDDVPLELCSELLRLPIK
ncbi:MAG: hypothetical protein OEQ14_13600, partial [Gammaproteobacteria bacterium]|nr:hypothetical protein [Gammaproteobacteria bacterium]